jgi:hypothetical protein
LFISQFFSSRHRFSLARPFMRWLLLIMLFDPLRDHPLKRRARHLHRRDVGTSFSSRQILRNRDGAKTHAIADAVALK